MNPGSAPDGSDISHTSFPTFYILGPYRYDMICYRLGLRSDEI